MGRPGVHVEADRRAPARRGRIGLLRGYARQGLDAARAVWRLDTDRTRTQRAALLAFAIRAGSAGIAYLSQAIIARWMGSFEYGVFVFVWVWVLGLGAASSAGLGIAMMRFVPEYLEKGQLALLRGLLLGSRLFAFGLGTVIAGLGLLGLHLLGGLVTGPYVMPAYLALICIPMFAVTDVQDGIGRARQWIGIGLVPPYILRPLLILVCMAGAHFLHMPTCARTAAASAIVATWGAGLIQMLLLRRRLNKQLPAGERAFDFQFWLKTSLPILMITGFDVVVQNTDVLMISLFMKPDDVAFYYAGVKTIGLIAFVHYAVATAVAHQFSALHARGDKQVLSDFVRDAVAWTFWPSLAGAVAILALGQPLLWLFGPGFGNGYGPMFVLAIGLLLKAAVGPAEFLLNMVGEQKRCGWVLLFTAVLDIALNAVLVPSFGLWGAATATSVSLGVVSILYSVLIKRQLGLDIGIWHVAPWPWIKKVRPA